MLNFKACVPEQPLERQINVSRYRWKCPNLTKNQIKHRGACLHFHLPIYRVVCTKWSATGWARTWCFSTMKIVFNRIYWIKKFQFEICRFIVGLRHTSAKSNHTCTIYQFNYLIRNSIFSTRARNQQMHSWRSKGESAVLEKTTSADKLQNDKNHDLCSTRILCLRNHPIGTKTRLDPSQLTTYSNGK